MTMENPVETLAPDPRKLPPWHLTGIVGEMVEAGIEAWAKAANERLDPEHVMHAALTAALAKIEAGTVEHPDSVRLREAAKSIESMVAEWYYGAGRKHMPASIIEKRLQRFFGGTNGQ